MVTNTCGGSTTCGDITVSNKQCCYNTNTKRLGLCSTLKYNKVEESALNLNYFIFGYNCISSGPTLRVFLFLLY